MSDYFEHERERYDGDDGPSIFPLPLPIPNGDLVINEYCRLIEAGCAISDRMPAATQAEFIEKSLVPAWAAMMSRVTRLDASVDVVRRADGGE